jgi:hypothetical protein
MEWKRDIQNNPDSYQLLFVKKDLFDATGSLKLVTDQWDDQWVRREQRDYVVDPGPDFFEHIPPSDDDIPF